MSNPLSILVIDDDTNFVYTLSEILKMHNWTVDIADNGEKGIKMVKAKAYDLILLDIRMPGIDGVQTFGEIKKIQPGTIVFMMTGGPIDNLLDLQKQGISTIIQKPINVSKIVDMISNVKKKGLVLVVDDNEHDRELLSDILQEKGYRILKAETGQEAIKYTSESEFDVVLLDIRLPDMSGVHVLEQIKAKKPATSIIMITGYNLDETIEKIIDKGAHTCFLKPFNVEMMLQEISSLIQKRNESLTDNKDINKEVKILLVEDNESIRVTMKEILEEEGFIVNTASNISEAQKIINEETQNMVISDLNLGEDSGLSLVEPVRKKGKHTVFLLMTGFGTMETALEAIAKDIDEYILKPVKPAELIHKVKTHLEKQRLNKEKENLVQQLQESNIKLFELSRVDDLTGVFNRRCFFEELHNKMHKSQRQKTSLALMMCDIDGFKKYNDTYGHVQGDKLLKEIAEILRNSVRHYVDQVFRYGGDEFAIIVLEISRENCQAVADRIIENIIKNFKSFNVGISIGISYFEEANQEISMNEFVISADKKLYEAKKAGGNKIVM